MFFLLSLITFCTSLQSQDLNLKEVYPQAYSWCIQTQKELCPQQHKNVTYKIGSCWKAFSIEHTIYIPEQAAQTIEYLSNKKNLSFEEKLQLQKYKGLLGHELGHIMYDNDPLSLAVMLSASSFLVYCSSYIVQNTSLLLKLFTFIFTSATSLIATDFLRKQYKEMQADKFVIDTKNFDAIEGLYKQFESSYVKNLTQACKNNAEDSTNMLSKLYYNCCGWICAQSWMPENIFYVFWDQDHPSHQSRIDKLKKALTHL